MTISEMIGKSDCAVMEWKTTFLSNQGSFPDTLQGKYQRSGVMWQNEELNKLATQYVRKNAAVKG